MRLNLTKNVRFADNDKGTCMRVDSLILSIDDLLDDMIKKDPLEKCLIESLFINDLEFEHLSYIQEILETILSIDENGVIVVV